jgi:hypothetical protein
MIEKLDETNFLLFAAKHYDNPQCFDTIEFYEDLNRFKYIKRLLNKFKETGDLKDRLIFNHLTVLFNVFGTQACCRMLFMKLEDYHEEILPFLNVMGTTPALIEKIGLEGKDVFPQNIKVNKTVYDILKRNIDD